MRRSTLIMLILVVLAVGGYVGYTQVYVPSIPATPTPEPVEDYEMVIWASGEVVPARWADLSFPIEGQLIELTVAEGDEVTTGTVLARLDAAEYEDAVTAAIANRDAAMADMERVEAGPRPSQIAQAEAVLGSAQAVKKAAEARLDQSKAELAQLLAGSRPEDLEASAAVLMKAEATLRQAQAEYDKIAWAADVGETAQALALETATLDYAVAEANYQALLQGARPEEVQAAQAAVAAAEANVDQAQSEVEAAQAELDLLRAGALKEEIAVAAATVEVAEADLAAAETALTRTVLAAPFDGTVSKVYLRIGEQVMAVQLQPILTLGDLSTLRVETTDLRETDVDHISVGQEVDVTFDALPDTLLKGRVVSISPKSTSEKGGVNYTTIIEFDQTDPRLRWGMTAYINITVE